MTVAVILCTAFRALFRRKVKARAYAAVGYEFGIFARRADIVCTKRIDLRNSRHSGDEGRADRSTGADKVSLAFGKRHQLLRRNVHDRKSVLDYGIQFPFKPVGNDVRQRIAVYLMCPFVCYFGQYIVRAFYFRRIVTRRHGTDIAVDHGGYFCRIVDDDLPCAVAEIAEIGQHLIGGLKIERRLMLSVFKALSCH